MHVTTADTLFARFNGNLLTGLYANATKEGLHFVFFLFQEFLLAVALVIFAPLPPLLLLLFELLEITARKTNEYTFLQEKVSLSSNLAY